MQISNSDIERQCDDVLVDFFQKFGVNLLALLGQVNPNIKDLLTGDIRSIEKSPKRHFATGQTDIGIIIENENTIIHLLIENKVMSPFTEFQPERYQSEVDGLNTRKNIVAISCLICPEKYANISSQATKFDSVLTYEKIVARIAKSRPLTKAIERCNAGWIAEEVQSVTDNFTGYVQLAKQFKCLDVKTKPSNKPTQSRTIYYCERRADLVKPYLPRIRFNHQWQEGRTKILFAGWGKFRIVLEPIIREDLRGTGVFLDNKKTKSVGIMIPTPIINNHSDFASQKNAMMAGLTKAQILRDFIVNNDELPRKWASIVKECE